MPNKKTATTETQKKNETLKRKLSVSKKLSDSVVARKALKTNKKPAVKKAKIEAKITVSKPAKTKAGSLSASVYDVKGKVAGHIELPKEMFGVKINDVLISQAVRVYLANQRQGTAKTKDRGEVDRTTKKIWQQKGTGRARHGSRRAPIFVGGGRVFGPRPRDFSLHLSKKMKTQALFSSLSSKLKDNEIKIIKGLETIEPKTKIMAQVLQALGIEQDKKVLLVMPKIDTNVYRAGRNIEGMQILSANTLNTYRVLDNNLILLMKDSIDILKDTFVKLKD